MDDNISVTSYEDISPPRPDRKVADETGLDKLKALIARSAANGDSAEGLIPDEVPDVCYVLQYQGWGGKIVDVTRSRDPIDVQLDQLNGADSFAPGSKRPVLEIVTKISPYHNPPSPPRPPRRSTRGPPRVPRIDWAAGYDDDYSAGGSDAHYSQVEEKTMVIYSEHLINALRAVVSYYPAVSFLGESARIKAPYAVLYHHRAALSRYRTHQPEIHDPEYALTTAKHIDVLLDFLEKNLGDYFRQEEKLHSSAAPKATFDKLWMLLKPGEVVYAQFEHRWTPFVISRVFPGSFAGRRSTYVIECWHIAYESHQYVRVMREFEVEPFSGEESIASLSVVPARFFRGEHKDTEPADVRSQQIALGKTVWELGKSPKYMEYEGALVAKELSLDEYNRNLPQGVTGTMSGRVIVDVEGYQSYSADCPADRRRGRDNPVGPLEPPPKDQLPHFAPRCPCATCKREGAGETPGAFANFEYLSPVKDAAPASDLYYLVLSKVVSGFILAEHRWGHFNVENLREFAFDRESFKYLVLDDEIKKTVKALIGKFANADGKVTPWPSDFIKNKGQGRIFLLHGSPGVGKTCTAECVADLTRRPLLSLTSGDLHDSYDNEKYLDYFLKLGERFGAVVLIDEADVYLESRGSHDVWRNAMVSTFLRALEYFRGVMFLTTNRVRSFDPAFTSRIHVALRYRALTDADRERIWLQGFERLERDSGGRVRVSVATREYAYASRDVSALRWNGREIRNGLQTAVALAEADALEDGVAVAADDDNAATVVTVTDKHLRAVVKMSRGFKNFMSKRKKSRAGNLGAQVDSDDSDDDDDDVKDGEEKGKYDVAGDVEDGEEKGKYDIKW
ncbi:P-loop containing nucleoside triphosphate hydrolase protein [Xylariomycetidae sp. FL2044]|nr:P-loop containing nucleoside triphosphate hydrolase protein [Xylariomycetidae sp. FL2044]